MAQEMLTSAKMIIGEVTNVVVISMLEEDGLSGTAAKLETTIKNISDEREILVLADLKGGTPCNVATLKMGEYPNLRVLSGVNLAILIEALVSSESNVDKLVTYLLAIGHSSIEKITPETSFVEEEYEEE